ncbi:hypothetical protein [Actinomadura parmotrematis]|uniref:Bulb-type lectin domain-containing protein n=1 Tax=Actinomadura parmotrematis TaxID=2864039 RepID=A0ABS7FY12_9ACTN|nr:hypothetical protein [Actinomadura parmotrematis]MBW8485330.1 hypothetical protein [Actinomadura parmotrematis]
MKIKLIVGAAAALAAAGAAAVAVPSLAAPSTATPVAAAQATSSVLKSGQTLKAGRSLHSPDGRYKLIMQTDGNLVVYKKSKAIWSSHTWVKGSSATMRTNGDLVVAKGSHQYWRSHTDGDKGAYLKLQNDGNAVVYKGKTALWSSYQWISTLSNGVTLYPYQKVVSQNGAWQLRQEPGGDLALYSGGKLRWHTGTSGHKGATTTMQADGNLVVRAGGKALWSTHTWHKSTWLAVQNDGNVVVYTGHMQALWDRYHGHH